MILKQKRRPYAPFHMQHLSAPYVSSMPYENNRPTL
eukprot:CAMPEP_0119400262 /NCGR_PEP_ID=MMETSP1334-20130426/141775_1 /TAXON_ID=127549 /ORGANISM="Calcidiscus leptoporus, Strain RCC1130" /LENGTH=35 /DNA_ID= /DNA_START= /DNA_END= /DNA_ORIENTATION=